MTDFSSNSNFRYLEIIIMSLISLLAIWTIGKVVENQLFSIMTIVLLIFSITILIRYYLRQVFDIEFDDKLFIVKYKYRKERKKQIDYEKISKISLVYERGVGRIITMRYFDSQKKKKFRFSTVTEDEKFMIFVKFLKSKNDKIEFKFAVPFSGLESEYQKIYPTKFRKVLKSTL